ncbi:hypothetical protein [Jannaschia donghaensis]|uniref:Uncharacterized protein n=1 Tax=Jannaschia donghaensis TaxID=420998 RepID=A0A0M6YGV0_9RHOB|nr:hypothetical protein [Jannaschia donghaensis]CTQ49571.1 hypothetical protein JDO7802_01585 [Jannaschia donghaensis]
MTKVYLPPVALRVFFLFCIVDAGFIAAFAIGHDAGLPEAFWLGRDSGWPERFNFLKWAIIAALCTGVAVRWRNPLFFGLALAALVLLYDDSRQLHERLPVLILDVTGLRRLGLPGDHMLTSVAVFGVIGLVCAALVALSLRLGPAQNPESARLVLTDTIRLVGLLAFFGIGVDLVHGIVDKLLPVASLLLTVLEEGGEMVSLSLLLSYFARQAMLPERTGRELAGRPASRAKTRPTDVR